MEIIKKVNYENEENTYILISDGETAVIDPGIKNIEVKNLKYIILTHCHYDHIEGLRELKEKTGASVVFSKIGSSNLNDGYINLSEMVYGKNIGLKPDILVSDGDKIMLGKDEILCIETPGHTSCGMSYLWEDNLFSGDTLFKNSIGRTDFKTGNFSVLEGSLKNKIYKLPENVKVYPGHGDMTDVGYEKKYNSFVRG